MQKKIIALAVAALASTAAFAQTNVTIYGVADLGQAFVNVSGAGTSGASVSRLDSNSSLIGFKGVEDLGNGLKAVFQFESNVSADTNVGGLNGVRDSYIGLAGGFGTLVLGNITHPLRTMGAKVDLIPGAAGFGTMASVTGQIGGLHTGADDRAANTVAYVSPSFGGLTGTVAYINGENRVSTAAAGGVANQHAFQVAAQYDNGPIYAGVGYHKVNDTGLNATPAVVASAGENVSVIRAAGAYMFPTKTKVTALVDRTKLDGAIGGVEAKRLAWSLSVSQGFGKNTIGLQYGRSGNIKADGANVADTSSSIASLIYTYDISKRTMIHARLSRLNNSSEVNNGFYNNAVAQGLTTADGADYTGGMVGVRHSF